MSGKKAHFIGIGGVGMSATAKLLKDSGMAVTGSDEAVYPPISDFLEAQGLPYKTPYAAENIPPDADLLVIGKNAKLVPETNPEVAAALASGKKIMSFPEVLGGLSEGKETVVVAGSYGKSTTTALLAHCLTEAGLETSFCIGASPYTPSVSATLGRGNLFVLEGDEYPASNTDPRSKFLLMHPTDLLVTPLAHDHFNVFPAPADYLKPFAQLLTLPPPQGLLIVCTEGALSKELLEHAGRPVITYGVSLVSFQARDIAWGEQTSFSINKDGAPVVQVRMSQLGEHNIQNIVGVAAFVFSKQLMAPEQFASAVASFKGIRRRLDRKSEKTRIPVFEGFGSSYEKLQSAVAAMRLHFPARRLLVVFEPNTIGWRSRAALAQYDTAFAGASKVYIFEPPHDGKESELSLGDMTGRVEAAGIAAVGAHTADETLAQLEKDLGENDCILISSSGAMGGLPESIPALAEHTFPK
jgi:UDP-N-acetylmuramate: L-alanyl-gamma-D-glutamyl-meso-diaminopimelate ligase